jgi:amino acid permease
VSLVLIFFPALMLIFTPLVMIRNTEKLAFTHLIGDFLIVFVLGSILYLGGVEIGENDPHLSGNKAYVGPTAALSAFSYSAFAFEGVAVVLPLRELVEDKSSYMKIIVTVVSGICIFYIIFAEFCNFAWGS